MKPTLSTMSPVPWTVLTHDLQASAKDPMTSPAVQRLSNYGTSITENQRILDEIADRAKGIETQRSDKPKRPAFHVSPAQVFVWSKGREYRFDSVTKAVNAGYFINTKTMRKIRCGGHHQTTTGNLYWCLDAPECVHQWRLTGAMILPKLVRKPITRGLRRQVPCYAYLPGKGVSFHASMKEALVLATGRDHGNVKTKISHGVGCHHFPNGTWVWRATVATPGEVVMLMANPSFDPEVLGFRDNPAFGKDRPDQQAKGERDV